MGLFDKTVDRKVEETKEEVKEVVISLKPYIFVALLMLGSYYAGKASALQTIMCSR